MRSFYSVGCLLALTLVTAVFASPTGQSKSLFGRKPGDYIVQRDDNNRQKMVGENPAFLCVSLSLQWMGFKVTWDEHSLFLGGERIMIFSGEVHPWR